MDLGNEVSVIYKKIMTCYLRIHKNVGNWPTERSEVELISQLNYLIKLGIVHQQLRHAADLAQAELNTIDRLGSNYSADTLEPLFDELEQLWS